MTRQPAARLLCTLLLVGILWHAVGGAQAWGLLRGADPVWLAAAALLLTVQTVLAALRWRLTAARLGHDLPMGRALREYYLAQTLNQALPGGVLGDAGRALRASATAGWARAAQAVVFERLAGQAALVLVTLLAVAMVTLRPGGLTLPGWVLLPLAGAALALALAAGWVWRGDGLTGWRAAAGQALLHRNVLPQQLALSLGTVLANLGAFACCAAAIGTVLPLAAVLTLVPLILFAMLIPLTIGGWGFREGAAAALFPLAGASPAAGLAASAAFGMLCLAMTLPGLLLPARPSGTALPPSGAGPGKRHPL